MGLLDKSSVNNYDGVVATAAEQRCRRRLLRQTRSRDKLVSWLKVVLILDPARRSSDGSWLYLGSGADPRGGGMGGETKREGVLFRSFQSEARSFCCFFHRFAQIYVLITISLWDIGFKWWFMTLYFCFERVLLTMRGCTFSLRGCSRTLKTPNSPPAGGGEGPTPGHLKNTDFSMFLPLNYVFCSFEVCF